MKIRYPTITLFKHGIRGRGAEFRGSRSPEALVEFIGKHARNALLPVPTNENVNSAADLPVHIEPENLLDEDLDESSPTTSTSKARRIPKTNIMGSYPGSDSEGVETLRKVSSHFLEGACRFHVKLLPEENATLAAVTSFDPKDKAFDTFEGSPHDFIGACCV